MKTIAYFCKRILISSIAIVLCACGQNGEFQLLDGSSRTLDDYDGKWVVVNFWAEWCAPCIKEIPELNRLSAEGQSTDIIVLGVSFDPLSNSELKKRVVALDFKYPIMATEPVPILPFGLPASLPTNYILDPDGEVVAKLVGTQSYHSLQQALTKAKKERQKSS